MRAGRRWSSSRGLRPEWGGRRPGPSPSGARAWASSPGAGTGSTGPAGTSRRPGAGPSPCRPTSPTPTRSRPPRPPSRTPLNTPQFGWVKSRLPRKAQPVPPIYQPEVAAEAIVWAAHHGHRELNVGMPTIEAELVNKVAPGFADRYLARTGYDAQQTDEPADPNRPDNLWEPVPGDHG